MNKYGYKRSMSKKVVLKTIQCVNDSLVQLKMSSFVQETGKKLHLMNLWLN